MNSQDFPITLIGDASHKEKQAETVSRLLRKKPYQPKTGQPCHCKRGVQRDNCPACEGTGWCVDFRAIRQTAPPDTVTRYAVTYVRHPGDALSYRCLAVANQGRNHHDSMKAAESWLSAVRDQLVEKQILTPEQGETLRAQAVECYAHGDAVKSVYPLD